MFADGVIPPLKDAKDSKYEMKGLLPWASSADNYTQHEMV